jgi:hypothetical protein
VETQHPPWSSHSGCRECQVREMATVGQDVEQRQRRYQAWKLMTILEQCVLGCWLLLSALYRFEHLFALEGEVSDESVLVASRPERFREGPFILQENFPSEKTGQKSDVALAWGPGEEARFCGDCDSSKVLRREEWSSSWPLLLVGGLQCPGDGVS